MSTIIRSRTTEKSYRIDESEELSQLILEHVSNKEDWSVEDESKDTDNQNIYEVYVAKVKPR